MPTKAPAANHVLASSAIEISNNFLTENELAQRLGVAVSTLRRWQALRTGPPRSTVGRRFYYSRQKLDAWIEAKALILHRGR